MLCLTFFGRRKQKMDGVGEWGDDPFEPTGQAIDSDGSEDGVSRRAGRKREAQEPAVPAPVAKQLRAVSPPRSILPVLEYPLQGDLNLETSLQQVNTFL